MFDFKLTTPCRITFAGPSMSGKTYRVFKILEYAEIMLDKPEHAKNVFFFYNKWTKEYDKNKHLVTEWINQCPTTELIEEKAYPFKDGEGCIIVIDDFGSELTKDIVKFFTVSSHHMHVSGFLLTQNLFPGEKYARSCALNTSHTLIFNGKRDRSQINTFGRQIGNSKALRQAFEKATRNNPYSYLWVNHAIDTNKVFTLGSHICVDEWPPVYYLENEEEN